MVVTSLQEEYRVQYVSRRCLVIVCHGIYLVGTEDNGNKTFFHDIGFGTYSSNGCERYKFKDLASANDKLRLQEIANKRFVEKFGETYKLKFEIVEL